MSYKSLKRALGETSLERKCRFLFGACLLLLITASFWSYGILTERVVYEQNQIRGQLLVDRAVQARHVENLASILNIFRKNATKPAIGKRSGLDEKRRLSYTRHHQARQQTKVRVVFYLGQQHRRHEPAERRLTKKNCWKNTKTSPRPARRPIATFPNSMKARQRMTNIFIIKQFARKELV